VKAAALKKKAAFDFQLTCSKFWASESAADKVAGVGSGSGCRAPVRSQLKIKVR